MTAEDAAQLFKSAWNTLAAGYTRQLAPRFDDWLEDAVQALEGLPDGQIWVPTCGPGREINMLAERFPKHSIVGGDFAKELVKIARLNLEQSHISDRASAEVVDCTSVPAQLPQLAGIVSCFGLMVLPQPQETIGHYMDALAPGGVVVALFLPGPDHQTDHTLMDILKLPYKYLGAPAANPWEAALAEQVAQHGGEIVSDTYVSHDMHFDSLSNFFQVMATSIAPLEVLRRNIGEEGMQRAHAEFVEAHGSPKGPFTVSPCARLLVARKK